MPNVNLRAIPRPLYLTEEEALALLDIAVLSGLDLTPVQEQAVARLGEFCRAVMAPPERRPGRETAGPWQAA